MRKIKVTPRYVKKGGIDLTALIDLVFLLVVFFMVSSSLGKVSSVNVTLPFAENSSEKVNAETIISVDENSAIFLNDSPIDEERLKDNLSAGIKDVKKGKVLIRGDKSADYGVIIKIMDTLSSLGVNNFTFSTKRAK